MSHEYVAVTLYLDSLFLMNAGMNLWLLFLVRSFLKLRARPVRMVAAAAAGAAGSCGAALVTLWLWRAGVVRGRNLLAAPGIRLAGWGLGLGWLMIRMAFGKAGWRDSLKRLAVLWMTAAFTGGLLSAGYGRITGPGHGGIHIRDLPVFTAAMAGIWLAAAGCWNLVQGRLCEKRSFCEAVLSEGGRTIRVQALWDTGNQLFEPYTHQPVHVITRAACERLCGQVSGGILIPFQAVGTRSGLLQAVRVEQMDVIREGVPVKHYERPWLALSEEELSPQGRYEMLLHGEE